MMVAMTTLVGFGDASIAILCVRLMPHVREDGEVGADVAIWRSRDACSNSLLRTYLRAERTWTCGKRVRYHTYKGVDIQSLLPEMQGPGGGSGCICDGAPSAMTPATATTATTATTTEAKCYDGCVRVCMTSDNVTAQNDASATDRVALLLLLAPLELSLLAKFQPKCCSNDVIAENAVTSSRFLYHSVPALLSLLSLLPIVAQPL
jgi:hypothetical protein